MAEPTFLHLCTALLRHSCDRGNNRRKVSPAISPSLSYFPSTAACNYSENERNSLPSWRVISENQRGARGDLAEFKVLLCEEIVEKRKRLSSIPIAGMIRQTTSCPLAADRTATDRRCIRVFRNCATASTSEADEMEFARV